MLAPWDASSRTFRFLSKFVEPSPANRVLRGPGRLNKSIAGDGDPGRGADLGPGAPGRVRLPAGKILENADSPQRA
ncbi:MAG: hypothetical protein ACLP4V_09220 [Methylocella sp.]